jgi:hypothetical protein
VIRRGLGSPLEDGIFGQRYAPISPVELTGFTIQ